jgi:hypothetical protein
MNQKTKRAAIYFIIIACSWFSCATAAAQQKNTAAAGDIINEMPVATIDIATVYALHPAMVYYDSELNLFIRPPETPATPEIFSDIMNKRRDEFQKNTNAKAGELKKIKDEIEALKEEVKSIGHKKILDAQPVNEKFDAQIQNATNEGELKKLLVQRTEALKLIEASGEIEIKSKKAKISTLLDSYEQQQMSLLQTYYLSADETAKKFEEISKDIKEAVMIAAKKNNVKAVVNYNLAADKGAGDQNTEKSVSEKTENNRQLEELLEKGPDYSGVLKSAKLYDSPKEAGAGLKIKNHINKIEQIKEFTASPFIGGKGKDLTWFTVITVMVKNGIPKEKAESISEVISEIYKRGEN